MVPAAATWHPAAAVAQPQRAADRRKNTASAAAHIEQLALLADLHVDPGAVAGEHPRDVNRHRGAVAQESSNSTGALLKLLFGGDDDQIVARAERAWTIV